MTRTHRTRVLRAFLSVMFLWVCMCTRAAAQGTAYCAGDGTGTACPCSNFGFGGGGCSNSTFPGAILSAQGVASLSNDTLRIRCTLLPFDPNKTVVLFQGATPMNGGAGAPFGAGLLCISGSVRRLAVQSLAGGLLDVGPAVGDPPLSSTGQITAPGTVMRYQAWYRDMLVGCSQQPFNLSNGLAVTWGA